MLKKVATGLVLSLILIVAAGSALVLIGPTIPLGGLSPQISWILSHATGRKQQVSGEFFLTPGEWTNLRVEQAAVSLIGKNGATLRGSIDSAQVTLHLWSTVRGRLRFGDIRATAVTADIVPGRVVEKEYDQDFAEFFNSDIGVLFPVEAGVIDLERITANIAYRDDRPGQNIHVGRVNGSISQSAPVELQVAARVGDHAFKASINGSPLGFLTDEQKTWNYTSRLTYKSVQAYLTGTISGTDGTAKLVTGIEISGQHMNDITSVFGRRTSVNQPFAVQAELELADGRMRALVSEFSPGTSELDLNLTATGRDFRSANYTIVLTSSQVDLDAIKTLFKEPEWAGNVEGSGPDKQKISREDALLPEHLPSVDFSIDLNLDELVIADHSVFDISLKATLHGGRLEVIPFQATLTNLQGLGSAVLDVNQEEPEISIQFESSEIDVGGILRELGIAGEDEFVYLHVASSRLNLISRGRTLGALRSQLKFSINANEGLYRYKDPNTGAEMALELIHSSIEFRAGEKLAIFLNGRVDAVPVDISLSIDDQPNSPWASLGRLPLHVAVNSVDTTWELEGHVPIPFSLNGVRLTSNLRGEHLSDLNELLKLALPDIGPYELVGKFERNETGYLLEGLSLLIGTSSLAGSIMLDTAVSPPHVDVSLESQRIQLNDFRSLRPMSVSAEDASTSSAPVQAGGDTQLDQLDPQSRQRFLTDQEILGRYNASVRVDVAEVLSEADFLGSGRVQIEQRDGNLRIDPLELNLPGGRVAIHLFQEPSGEDRSYRLNISMEDFDYGIIGRRVRPDTDMAGALNLLVSLEAESPDFKSIMKNASGYLNISVHPQRLSSGVIDLWAVNFLTYLFSFFTEESQSKVNCMAGRFRLDSGQLNEEELLIDTSKIQVKGTVDIDFLNQQISSYLRPIPKRPQFFSLATPIEINGSFENPGVRLPPSGIIGTIARVATSYIVVPIQWIILNKLPEDGSEKCLEIFARQADPDVDKE